MKFISRTREEQTQPVCDEEEFSDDDESKFNGGLEVVTTKLAGNNFDSTPAESPPYSRELSDAALSDENSPVPAKGA